MEVARVLVLAATGLLCLGFVFMVAREVALKYRDCRKDKEEDE